LRLEDIGEAALGEAAVERHLAALKSAFLAESRAGVLSLAAARGGLSVAGTHAPPNAFAAFLLAGRRS
jgi:hypothetical protein